MRKTMDFFSNLGGANNLSSSGNSMFGNLDSSSNFNGMSGATGGQNILNQGQAAGNVNSNQFQSWNSSDQWSTLGNLNFTAKSPTPGANPVHMNALLRGSNTTPTGGRPMSGLSQTQAQRNVGNLNNINLGGLGMGSAASSSANSGGWINMNVPGTGFGMNNGLGLNLMNDMNNSMSLDNHLISNANQLGNIRQFNVGLSQQGQLRRHDSGNLGLGMGNLNGMNMNVNSMNLNDMQNQMNFGLGIGMNPQSQLQQTQNQANTQQLQGQSQLLMQAQADGNVHMPSTLSPEKAKTKKASPKVMKPTKTKQVYDYEGKKVEIRDVWKHNLNEEMSIIRRIVMKYNFIAMDTEFPGVVARPQGPFPENDYNYQFLRCNVDLLKLIQLGVAFSDENGNFAKKTDGMSPSSRRRSIKEIEEDENILWCCWQFHFNFSLEEDMYAQDSIDLLKRSGIDFELHEAHGIDVLDFGALLTSSGLVLMSDVHWISFHGLYDFGYLLKVLTCLPLPEKEDQFHDLLRAYFPNFYDLKYMVKQDWGFVGGLNKLAEMVHAKRIGPEHQAGSDSLLTLSVFFNLKRKHFENVEKEKDFKNKVGVLHGIGLGGNNVTNPQIGAGPGGSPTMANS